MNRADELRRLIRRANMPPSAVVLFDTIVDHTDWSTGRLPGKYQPRSLDELARWAGIPTRTAADVLNLLEENGWVQRNRPEVLRRGEATTYQPREGRPRPPGALPVPGSARSRAWRQRQKAKAADLRERDETLAPIVTQNLHQSTVQVAVTSSQVSTGSARWASVGGVSGSSAKTTATAAGRRTTKRTGTGYRARALADCVASDPCGGMPYSGARRHFAHWSQAEWNAARSYAYRLRLVDFIRGYIVTSVVNGGSAS